MAELGSIAILIAFVMAIYAACAAVIGARRGMDDLAASARNAVFVVAALLTLAALALAYAFITRDFRIEYVARESSLDMPWYYVVVAFWGGQEGSLLYWAWTLALFAALAVALNWRAQRVLMPYVVAVLMGLEIFFVAMLAFVSNPFKLLPFTPANGLGLNPLLQDNGMMIHPPMLLLGYMSTSIPFAFAMAALLSGKLDAAWLRVTRRWTLTSWAVLTAGNLFGAWWSYHVLGWGGYWGWDPVENSAFMPWLAMTAYLHSVIVQEKRGMLKVWNLALIILAFNLSLFGTFVVRSGVIQSVHSFAQSSLGVFFFGFLGLSIVFSVALLFSRMNRLRDDRALGDLLSREVGFLFNNLLLIGITFATFVGVIFPLLTEAVRNEKLTVGPPYYSQVNGPIFLALMALMGIGPLLPWHRASRANLIRSFGMPLTVLALTVVIFFALGMRDAPALLAFGTLALVAATVVQEFYRGVRARQTATGEAAPLALLRLTWRNQQRYGGYLVHLGIVVMAVAIVATQFFQVSKVVGLDPGESVNLGRYTLTYQNLSEDQSDAAKPLTFAQVAVSADGKPLGVIAPGKRVYRNYENQPVSEISITTTLFEDLYVVLASYGAGGVASFYLFVNPMQVWLWIGGALTLFGGLVAWWPRRLEVRESVRVSAGHERAADAG